MLSPLYLASQSPRRRELLAQLGWEARVIPLEGEWVDETPHADETATDYVLRLAQAKAEAGWRRREALALPRGLVLGADTTVRIDGLILGKPRDADEARAMLRRLSGRRHEVHTGVAITDGSRTHALCSTSRVWFTTLADEDVERYLATEEPWDKAGAYAYQGRAAAFIERIEGSASGIVGLPLFETARLLSVFGYPPFL
ncbi:MAG: Maf family protein [Tepidiphilus sp.]|nr:Maf family protein [Tepidiphilus sp.]MDD3432265.1 Maf family protein [Tepidiphilus sp.]